MVCFVFFIKFNLIFTFSHSKLRLDRVCSYRKNPDVEFPTGISFLRHLSPKSELKMFVSVFLTLSGPKVVKN